MSVSAASSMASSMYLKRTLCEVMETLVAEESGGERYSDPMSMSARYMQIIIIVLCQKQFLWL